MSEENKFDNTNNSENTIENQVSDFSNVSGDSNPVTKENVVVASSAENKQNTEHVEENLTSLEFLKNLTGWATFKAIIDIITGGFSCLGIITIPYGITQIIAGIKLLKAVDDIKLYLANQDTRKIGDALYNFNKYFKFSGITIILKIVGFVLLFIMWVFLFAFIIRHANDWTRNFPF